MIPVHQRLSDDCFKCCVASILNLTYNEVPHFWDGPDQYMSPQRLVEMDAWFKVRGMSYMEMGYECGPVDAMLAVGRSPNTYILMGRNFRGHQHAVVCRGTEMIHDPSPTGGGVTMAGVDGYTRLGLILVARPDNPN